MAVYENVASEYEEAIMVDHEYESIRTPSNASYEEMNALPISSLMGNSRLPQEKSCEKRIVTIERRILATKILTGCFVGLLLGVILGVTATVYAARYNGGEQKPELESNFAETAMKTVGRDKDASKSSNTTAVKSTPSVHTTQSLSEVKSTIKPIMQHNQTIPVLPEDTTGATAFTLTSSSDTAVEFTTADDREVSKSVNAVGVTSGKSKHTLPYVTTNAIDVTPATDPDDMETTRATEAPKIHKEKHSKSPFVPRLPKVFPCDVRADGNCFSVQIFGTDTTTYVNAQFICRQLGGSVAMITSQKAYDYVVNKMRQKIPGTKFENTAWIGARVNSLTGAVEDPYSRCYVKWGVFEPNIGSLFASHTHVYIYVDTKYTQYTGMRNFSPLFKRDGVICQDKHFDMEM